MNSVHRSIKIDIVSLTISTQLFFHCQRKGQIQQRSLVVPLVAVLAKHPDDTQINRLAIWALLFLLDDVDYAASMEYMATLELNRRILLLADRAFLPGLLSEGCCLYPYLI